MEEVSNNGTLNIHIYRLLIFILKYIAPIGIGLIFINELGFFNKQQLDPFKDFYTSPGRKARYPCSHHWDSPHLSLRVYLFFPAKQQATF